MRTERLYLALRENDATRIVLRVTAFNWFRLGPTEVHSKSPGFEPFHVGRQFSTFGQAVYEITSHLYGKDAARCDYAREYEAYCIGDLDADHLGTAERKLALRHEQRTTSFSPLLATVPVEIAPDDSSGSGRWIKCGDLFPFVPLDTPDDAVEELMLRGVRRACRYFFSTPCRLPSRAALIPLP